MRLRLAVGCLDRLAEAALEQTLGGDAALVGARPVPGDGGGSAEEQAEREDEQRRDPGGAAVLGRGHDRLTSLQALVRGDQLVDEVVASERVVPQARASAGDGGCGERAVDEPRPLRDEPALVGDRCGLLWVVAGGRRSGRERAADAGEPGLVVVQGLGIAADGVGGERPVAAVHVRQERAGDGGLVGVELGRLALGVRGVEDARRHGGDGEDGEDDALHLHL